MRKAFFFVLLSTLILPLAVSAGEIPGEFYSWFFDADTIGRGYTISTVDDVFHIGVLPDVLLGETDVTIKVFDHSEYEKREIYQFNATAESNLDDTVERLVVDWGIPEGKKIISPIYEFDIKGAKDLYNPEKPLWLRMHYLAATDDNKGVYFYDKGQKSWIQIPAEQNPFDQSLRSAIHLTYAPIAILADEIPVQGEASWYAYQDCLCAASRHYPNGTLLEVTHVLTGKQVIVEVNDYGPEVWTERIIDLDLVAFEKLVPRTWGVTQVIVKPYLVNEADFENGTVPELFDQTL